MLRSPARGQDASQLSSKKSYDFTPVTQFCEHAYRATELPGASLLVYRDGQVIYEKYFGDYDETTQVPIASASKWLSGAVIMTLVDEGKLDLDAPVSKVLPNFVGKAGTINVRQMFSHTSGLVDLPGNWDYGITLAEYADRVAKDGVWRAEPGREIRYAGASMQVAGRVAEVVSGQGWNELVKQRLTIPCDMPDTLFARTENNKNPMLAGGAFSTLRDYSHFLEMIIQGGVYHGRRVLSEDAVREMQKDQTSAARKGNWKLVQAGDKVCLFDLSKDIGETNNLAEKMPEVVKDLQAAFEKWSQEMKPASWPARPGKAVEIDGAPYEIRI